jgi:hypothetical protein
MPKECMNVAPWLQALAAVVVAVLTYHLVKAPREYVRPTHELAQAARAQQEDQASQRAADHDYLGALVEQLREKARALPEGTATASVQTADSAVAPPTSPPPFRTG